MDDLGVYCLTQVKSDVDFLDVSGEISVVILRWVSIFSEIEYVLQLAKGNFILVFHKCVYANAIGTFGLSK